MLDKIIHDLVVSGKGFLAADESVSTMGKRLQSIGLVNTEDTRKQYRGLLAGTDSLGHYISGVILYEETLTQKNADGQMILDSFRDQGIVPGVKVDKGLVPVFGYSSETFTEGLDGLAQRLEWYREQGALFTKWRHVFQVPASYRVIVSNAEVHGRYAKLCQSFGMVPIVEPEILMEGNHTLEDCFELTSAVLSETFYALKRHGVSFEHMILKPNMIVPGKECAQTYSAECIAQATLKVLRRHVPAAVPGIYFLSGGLSPVQATAYLQAINDQGSQPWLLSFSFGRALQEPCLKAWQGKSEYIRQGQAALLKRAILNAKASLGDYAEDLDVMS